MKSLIVQLLPFYLTAVCLIGFLLMLADKRRAQKKQWRISQKALFCAAALGGALGVLAGMFAFRHKTRHPSFLFGIPALFLLNIVIILLINQCV